MKKKRRDDDNGGDKCVFPLTSLQIGDMQSYLSDLSIFLAVESNKLYILVDNRPWLEDLGSRPAHLWQLMVTKSRLSPFAKTKAPRSRIEEKKACSQSNPSKSRKLQRWFSLVDAATLSGKAGLPPVKKLRNSLFLSSELHRTLYGFIIFEVEWVHVRGINYLNELQTDTSLAIETKFMQRWEFDSIAQAAGCMSSWFSGTLSELLLLKKHLDSVIGDEFYDAEEDFSSVDSENDNAKDENDCSSYIASSNSRSIETSENRMGEPHTPPPTGPYKRRRITRSFSSGIEVDLYSEEIQSGIGYTSDDCETFSSDGESNTEAKQYEDILLLFRFSDRDLPFKLKDVVMSDTRLLTLLEAGLPSWVIFLQSYPGFCHLYRPWMCPLARALYVLISVITVLIGFYDLYKNVPVLKATASRLCGPLLDWIETWEMVSRIKYLGTMLFLHNFEKAVTWFLTVKRTTRSFFSFFTQPLVEPFAEILGFFLPMWNILIDVAESLCSIVWVTVDTFCNVLGDLLELVLWPISSVISIIWTIGTSIAYPVFWILGEVLYSPIRLILALVGFVASTCSWMSDLIVDLWQSMDSLIELSSTSQATVSTYEVSMWRSLWNDLFSQVFRAIRSILNGFVAFFTACNRHRLSIYNHMEELMERILHRSQRSPRSDSETTRPMHRTQRSPRSDSETTRPMHRTQRSPRSDSATIRPMHRTQRSPRSDSATTRHTHQTESTSEVVGRKIHFRSNASKF